MLLLGPLFSLLDLSQHIVELLHGIPDDDIISKFTPAKISHTTINPNTNSDIDSKYGMRKTQTKKNSAKHPLQRP